MRVAYADPPYIGQAKKHYADHADFAGEVDHGKLVAQLVNDYPDGWALSCSSTSLKYLLTLCPNDVRIGAWVKPFAVIKKNVRVTYAWEPLIFRGGRKDTTRPGAARDWVSANIVLRNHNETRGSKPTPFCMWLFEMLNLQQGDEFVDLFPGSGAVGDAWEWWSRQTRLPLTQPNQGTDGEAKKQQLSMEAA